MCKNGNLHVNVSSKSVVKREEKEKKARAKDVGSWESLIHRSQTAFSSGFNSRPSEMSCDYEASSCQKGAMRHTWWMPSWNNHNQMPPCKSQLKWKSKSCQLWYIRRRQFKQLLFVFYFELSFFLQTDHNSYNIIPSSRSNNICSIKRK